MIRMRFHHWFTLATAALLCLGVGVRALAPANPFGWEEQQPDGTPAGRLYLKGRPDSTAGVHVVDANDYPVVRDDEGWYVYGAPVVTDEDNDSTTLRGTDRRRLPSTGTATTPRFIPTEYRVTPDSQPPRHLQQVVLNPEVELNAKVVDFLCNGQDRSPWCPTNPLLKKGRMDALPITQGTVKSIVVLVQFSDHADYDMPSSSDIEFLFNGVANGDDRAPSGTMKDFWQYQSLGQYTVEAHVQDWIVLDQTEEYYSYGTNGLTSVFAQSSYDTLTRMDKAGTDWSQYDLNGDGVLDSVVILHSGYVAEVGGTDCRNNKEHGTHRIWSHATNVDDGWDAWYSESREVRIGPYCTTSALFGTCETQLQRIGVVGHEMLHMLGLPDLLGAEGTGVGIFDVMGMMWGLDGTLWYPPTTSPWCRARVGWVEPTRITSSGEYKIGTAQRYTDAYRIDLYPNEGEYLLIENRQKLHHDVILPGVGGLLIWHIDESATNFQSSPGFPLQEGWPGNGKHYQLSLLSPDTQYDMETGKNYGDDSDFWTPGTELKPGPARQEAIPQESSMYPNTDTYQGGVVANTGITIDDIRVVDGDFMTFRVTLPGSTIAFSETSEPTDSPTQRPTEQPITIITQPPTAQPITIVTQPPTAEPTVAPTQVPTPEPTTPSPTSAPSPEPTTLSPTSAPSPEPTTPSPTSAPSPAPVIRRLLLYDPLLHRPRHS